MSILTSLKLNHFRCYTQAQIADLRPGLVVLSGPNGAGKTNILEAISLLSPGRGLRGAKVMEIQCHTSGDPWAVAARLQTRYEEVSIGTGLDCTPGSEKRIVRINGKNEKAQGALAQYVACVWLTPQMDRLFLDSGRIPLFS